MEKLNHSYMGPILKQARIATKMTQEALDERVGKSARYLQAIENEEKGLGLETLIRILRTLNLSADTIVFSDRDIDSSESEQLMRLIRLLNSRDRKVLLAAIKQMLEAE